MSAEIRPVEWATYCQDCRHRYGPDFFTETDAHTFAEANPTCETCTTERTSR